MNKTVHLSSILFQLTATILLFFTKVYQQLPLGNIEHCYLLMGNKFVDHNNNIIFYLQVKKLLRKLGVKVKKSKGFNSSSSSSK